MFCIFIALNNKCVRPSTSSLRPGRYNNNNNNIILLLLLRHDNRRHSSPQPYPADVPSPYFLRRALRNMCCGKTSHYYYIFKCCSVYILTDAFLSYYNIHWLILHGVCRDKFHYIMPPWIYRVFNYV